MGRNKKSILLILLLSIVSFSPVLLFSGCSKDKDDKPKKDSPTGVISFSGYDWLVKSSDGNKVGPGPNYFSNENDGVWVDDSGRLHLTIKNKKGAWVCTEVTLLKSLGYGHYIFQIESNVEQLDKNIVAAVFLYKDDTKELDNEFSTWGQAHNMNAQFAVQPASKNGNKKRFDIQMEKEPITSIIDWQRETVTFSLYRGNIDNIGAQNLIKRWIYKGPDIPSEEEDLAPKINLWLFRGIPPSDQKDEELIISNFRYN